MKRRALVRSYELYLKTDLTLIGEKMEQAGAAHFFTLNDIPYRVVDLAAADRKSTRLNSSHL